MNLRDYFARVPLLLTMYVSLILGIGVVNLASAARVLRPNLPWVQLLWIVIGIAVALILGAIPASRLRSLLLPGYLCAITLLGGVLVFGIQVKGARRWIELGAFRLQPSELAKVATLAMVALLLSKRSERNGYTLTTLFRPLHPSRPLFLSGAMLAFLYTQWEVFDLDWLTGDRYDLHEGIFAGLALTLVLVWLVASLVRYFGEQEKPALIGPIECAALPFVLILVEPDLGTSLMLVLVCAAQILACGIRMRSFVYLMGSTGVVAGVAWTFIMHDYQKSRVINFLNPEADLHGAGYHAMQSMIAIGSGGQLGKGYGLGTQTQLSFLPENQTDFVFSVWAEEWGFLGVCVLFILFFLLLQQLFAMARTAKDDYVVLICVGVAAMFFWHMVVNVGMVMGVLPVVGVTLPLLSYGGSSMMTLFLCLGLVVNTQVWSDVEDDEAL